MDFTRTEQQEMITASGRSPVGGTATPTSVGVLPFGGVDGDQDAAIAACGRLWAHIPGSMRPSVAPVVDIVASNAAKLREAHLNPVPAPSNGAKVLAAFTGQGVECVPDFFRKISHVWKGT